VALLRRAQTLADLAIAQKRSLLAWIRVIEDVGAQFGEDCPVWPTPLSEHAGWQAFAGLTLAFYDKWNSHGLPFDGLGHPTALGVTYRQFVADFKALHGDRVCVACDGPLGTGQVDHWITKAHFPKSDTEFRVIIAAIHVEDEARAARLEELLCLGERWTKEFIAAYGVLQKMLRKLVKEGWISATADGLRSEINRELAKLLPEETYFELQRRLYHCVLEPERLDALVKACKE
jgi:hypothetical protein